MRSKLIFSYAYMQWDLFFFKPVATAAYSHGLHFSDRKKKSSSIFYTLQLVWIQTCSFAAAVDERVADTSPPNDMITAVFAFLIPVETFTLS